MIQWKGKAKKKETIGQEEEAPESKNNDCIYVTNTEVI